MMLGCLTAALGVTVPYFQKMFIDGLLASEKSDVSLVEAGVLLWIVASFGLALLAQAGIWLIRRLAIGESVVVQSQLSRSLYQHAIRLHPHARSRYSVGELVGFYAQDVAAGGGLTEESLPNLIASILPLVVAPLSVGILLGADVWPVAFVAVGGVGVCVVLAWRQAALFVTHKEDTQDRLGVVNEWLQNIKLLRVSGRMHDFEEQIFQKRLAETNSRMAMVTNASVMNAFAQFMPHMINIAGLMCLIYLRPGGFAQGLSPGEIFGIIWVLGLFLGSPLRQLPWAMVTVVDGVSSLKRIHCFLQEATIGSVEPMDPVALAAHGVGSQSTPSTPSDFQLIASHESVSISIQGLRVVGPDGKLLLEIDELEVLAGELVAIVGPVGAGKSLFVAALTRAIPADFDGYSIGGQSALQFELQGLQQLFTVVPQQSFIMNADLRRNVGLDYGALLPSDESLKLGMKLADFDPDGENLRDGLDTNLGERGVNLSGGQRQRLSLARAVQFNRPIVILDDSLSAVDVVTEQRIIDQLLLGEWRHKTRLLITHRMDVLPFVSKVLFFSGGKMMGCAPFSTMIERDPRFQEYVRHRNSETIHDPFFESGFPDASQRCFGGAEESLSPLGPKREPVP
jgi:ABC-type multidrug transport system fused ATPase/permease subunit